MLMQRTKQLGLLGTLEREEEVRLIREVLVSMENAYAEIFLPTVIFDETKFNKEVKRSKEILRRLL